jgi:copper transport protein
MFNEPVTPLVMRLIAPDGTAATPAATAENTTVTIKPPVPLRRGTHVLSWRVISADGHPVGGSLVFSVGEASAQPAQGVLPAGDPIVRAAFWAAKIVIYLAIVVGIGGMFARMWLWGRPSARLDRILVSLLVAGLVVTPLSVGLQGLDALDLRLPALAQGSVWETGLATSYGLTAIAAMVALFAALFAFEAAARAAKPVARGLSLAGLIGAGCALALSGHASSATPQLLTRPAVFVHVVGVAFWIGALAPLLAGLKIGDGGGLARFSRFIPVPLALLLISGVVLMVVQLDRIDALWTTRYGIVLACKLAVVLALLALAAANRYVATPRYQRGDVTAGRALSRTIRLELSVAIVILALVALWRFTPPPRALAATEPIEIHLHGTRAMAQLSLTPVRARAPRVDIQVLDGEFQILPVKEVTVTLASPASGIEPVRRPATLAAGGHWTVEGLRIPVAGQWIVRVDLLISDFEKIVLEDEIRLPRLP